MIPQPLLSIQQHLSKTSVNRAPHSQGQRRPLRHDAGSGFVILKPTTAITTLAGYDARPIYKNLGCHDVSFAAFNTASAFRNDGCFIIQLAEWFWNTLWQSRTRPVSRVSASISC